LARLLSSLIGRRPLKCHLERLDRSGLGINIYEVKNRIEVISPTSALCWITWGIKPKDGTQPWTWENVYGYRKVITPEGEEEHWEFVVADHELGELMKRKPTIMDS